VAKPRHPRYVIPSGSGSSPIPPRPPSRLINGQLFDGATDVDTRLEVNIRNFAAGSDTEKLLAAVSAAEDLNRPAIVKLDHGVTYYLQDTINVSGNLVVIDLNGATIYRDQDYGDTFTFGLDAEGLDTNRGSYSFCGIRNGRIYALGGTMTSGLHMRMQHIWTPLLEAIQIRNGHSHIDLASCMSPYLEGISITHDTGGVAELSTLDRPGVTDGRFGVRIGALAADGAKGVGGYIGRLNITGADLLRDPGDFDPFEDLGEMGDQGDSEEDPVPPPVLSQGIGLCLERGLLIQEHDDLEVAHSSVSRCERENYLIRPRFGMSTNGIGFTSCASDETRGRGVSLVADQGSISAVRWDGAMELGPESTSSQSLHIPGSGNRHIGLNIEDQGSGVGIKDIQFCGLIKGATKHAIRVNAGNTKGIQIHDIIIECNSELDENGAPIYDGIAIEKGRNIDIDNFLVRGSDSTGKAKARLGVAVSDENELVGTVDSVTIGNGRIMNCAVYNLRVSAKATNFRAHNIDARTASEIVGPKNLIERTGSLHDSPPVVEYSDGINPVRYALNLAGFILAAGATSEWIISAPGVETGDFVQRSSYSRSLPATARILHQCRRGAVAVWIQNTGSDPLSIPGGDLELVIAINYGGLPVEPGDGGFDLDPDLDPGLDLDLDPDQDPEPEPEPDPGPGPDPEPDPDPEPEPEPEPVPEPGLELDNSIVEPFTSAASTEANGWTGIGNTGANNGNNYLWQNSSAVTGTAGAAGGVFARNSSYSYFAATNIAPASRTNLLRLAGAFRLANVNFDGVFYLGYFNPSALVTGQAPQAFIGIEFSEPSGSASGPFRGVVSVKGPGGAASAVVSLEQNTSLSFDLLWTGAADGAGTLVGTLAGQAISLDVAAGASAFTAFGMFTGGLGASNQATGMCLFDDLRYRASAAPEPEPEPEPPGEAGGGEVQAVSSIVQWGDSMTSDLNATRMATALGDSRRIVNRGVGGQRSAEIAGRQGGLPVACTVEGGQIPASGAVAITFRSGSPAIARGVRAGVSVVIAGVAGLLKPVGTPSTSPTGYEFTRSSSGAAVPAAGEQPITPVLTDLVGGETFNLNGYLTVLWCGRNGVGLGLTDVSVYQSMIGQITGNPKKIIILPIFNGGFTGESDGDPAVPTTSTTGYTNIMNRNAAIAAAFPQYFYDIRRAFIDGAAAWLQDKYPAVYTNDWSKPFADRTQANLGPDSAWDVANDVPPRVLRRDRIHLNSMGNQFLAELLAARIAVVEAAAAAAGGGDPGPGTLPGDEGTPPIDDGGGDGGDGGDGGGGGGGGATIFRVTDAVKPSELVTIFGEGMTLQGTEVAVGGTGLSTPAATSPRLTVVHIDPNGHFVTAILPASVSPGVHNIWVRNSSDWSNALQLNAPRPQWLSMNRIANGLRVRVVGKNLDGREFGAARSTRVRLISGPSTLEATVLSVNPFAVEFTVPASVPAGTYTVSVSNNNGGVWRGLEESQQLTVEAQGGDPLGLGVAWAHDFAWSRVYTTAGYASLQAAIDALAAAGGGILDVPDGAYSLRSLQSAKGVVIRGQSRSGVVLRFTNANSTSSTNFITTKSNGTTDGLIGFTNLTVTIDAANTAQQFPDHFFNLGSSTAEKIFITDVDIVLPTASRTGGRARSIAIRASRYVLIRGVVVNGWRAYISNVVDRYMEISNCDLTSANQGMVVNVRNMYTTMLYNKLRFTSPLNDSSVARGYEATSHTYVEGNLVENCSGTGNWNEQILFEPRDGLTKMYGQVTSATATTVNIAPRTKNGVIYGHKGNNNWSLATSYPSGWYITIIDGRGLGQYRKITELSQANSRVTVERGWDVIPDVTSKFVISVLAVNNVAYRNIMRTGSKPLLFYHNSADAVFADNTSVNTQGFNITSYYVINSSTDEPNEVAATRYSIAYFNRMARNEAIGVAPVRGCSGIGYHFFLELYQARTEDAFANTCYGVDIKDNFVSSVLPAPSTNTRESPPVNGLYVGAFVRGGQGTRNTILAANIENNLIRDSNRGISLGGTLFPVWGSSATALSPTASMNSGVVVKGNRFMNVATQIVDNRPASTVLIDNGAINDTVAPVSVASVVGTLAEGELQSGNYSSSVSITLSASDSVSGVRRIEFSLDAGATWTVYEQPIVLTAPGSYSIRHRATDRAGNVESAKTLSLSIGETVGPDPLPPPPPPPPSEVETGTVQDLTSQVNPAQFAGEDHKYGYHLRHLPTVANAVLMEGPNRGFIDLPVWRSKQHNVPGNARVLENHVSLTFFYTADKPWNVYRGNQALRARLEAVLEFLISPVNLTLTNGNVDGVTQSIGLLGSDKVKDAPQNNELAGSAFGVKALGETLLMLEQSRLAGGPTINENLRQRVIGATRLIIRTCLGWVNFKVHGSRFSNQYTGFWGGAAAFLLAHPDANLRQLLVARITKLADKKNPEKITFSGRTWDFTLSSSAGFHYENEGPEWGYVFNTHYPNMAQLAKYERGTPLMSQVISMEQPWIEWLSYNAVRDPGGTDYVLNRAIQTRIATYSGFQIEELVLADSIPMARAFARTTSEDQTRETTLLQQLVNNWPNVGSLVTYPPNPFTRGDNTVNWRPTASQRTAAIASLPYLARDRFAHQRVDNRRPFQSTFIRRPTYYAAFNAGAKAADAQRYGLGLLWNPLMGAVLQTQRGTVAPWGTARVGGEPVEAAAFTPVVKVNGTVMQASAGARDFPSGDTGIVTFEYAVLGGTKVVTFNNDRISVSVRAANEFVELIPLLVRTTDTVTVLSNVVRLRRGGRDFEIQFPTGVRASTRAVTGGSPPRTFTVLHVTLRATTSMDYTLIFR